MKEIGDYCYSFYCEASNYLDKKGRRLPAFNDLPDTEKEVWVKVSMYTVMQFALLFGNALQANPMAEPEQKKEADVVEPIKNDGDDDEAE